MAAKPSTIQITDLLVNPENYRFDPVTGQKEAIDVMLADQEDKLFTLAEDITLNGLNPSERAMVSKSNHDKSKYIVLEGNRRIVTLKLLNNPDLIDQGKFSLLKKKFKQLRDEHRNDIPKEIDCVVFDDPSEADKWIKLKHTGENDGVGTVTWDKYQKERFTEKVEGKSSVALQVVRLLKESNDVPADVKKQLPDLKLTNLDRLLSDPQVREMLGITIEKDKVQSKVEQKEVMKGLVQVAKDILDPDFTVKKIYTKEEREDYIKKFPAASRPDTTKSAQPWHPGSVTTSTGGTAKSKKASSSKERKALIPKSCTLKIHNPKTNAIYNELQKISVDTYTNATAVLLRVFVELSADIFIEKNKLPKLSVNSKLVSKLVGVADYLEAKGLADKHLCKGIRNAVSNQHGLLGVETWHAYVHNSRYSATPRDLFITWDNIQAFMEKLWENVK